MSLHLSVRPSCLIIENNTKHPWGILSATQKVSRFMAIYVMRKQIFQHVSFVKQEASMYRFSKDKFNPLNNCIKACLLLIDQHLLLTFMEIRT